LPPLRAHITEYQCHKVACPRTAAGPPGPNFPPRCGVLLLDPVWLA
jgi:hypothetical protein